MYNILCQICRVYLQEIKNNMQACTANIIMWMANSGVSPELRTSCTERLLDMDEARFIELQLLEELRVWESKVANWEQTMVSDVLHAPLRKCLMIDS